MTSEKNERGRSPPILSRCENGMDSKIPLYKQEKYNTCALACLRMVLAAFGTDERSQHHPQACQCAGVILLLLVKWNLTVHSIFTSAQDRRRSAALVLF